MFKILILLPTRVNSTLASDHGCCEHCAKCDRRNVLLTLVVCCVDSQHLWCDAKVKQKAGQVCLSQWPYFKSNIRHYSTLNIFRNGTRWRQFQRSPPMQSVEWCQFQWLSDASASWHSSTSNNSKTVQDRATLTLAIYIVRVTIRVIRSTAITDLIVRPAVSTTIAEFFVFIYAQYYYFSQCCK